MANRNSHAKKERGKRHQIQVSSLTLFLWGFCALFFMAWIFVLGVLVGRGFLPGADTAITDLKAQVTKLQEMVARSKRGEQGPPLKKEGIDENLAFYERLESKKEEAKKREQSLAPSREGTREGSLIASKPELARKDIITPAESDKPGGGGRKGEPPTGKGSYTLQLASLEEKAKAEAMVRDLLSRGYDAYYYEVMLKGKIYYRVRCGRFMTREEAGSHAGRLLNDLSIRGFVTKFE